ncbi:alkaline-shock protein [Salmonella enterica subsp. enterica]|nr:alkaline-shock protein [Salmonella enterica subsp. enterica serovar Vitkin]
MTVKIVSETARLAIGKWDTIYQRLGVKIPANGKHGACPKCGGKDRFRMDDKDGEGTYFCNQCGSGDGLDLVKGVFSINSIQAAEKVREVLSVMPETNMPARKKESKVTNIRPPDWKKIISQTKQGTSRYLENKGLTGYTQLLTTRELSTAGVKFPPDSLLLPIVNTSGEITGIQLISDDGNKGVYSGSKFSGCFISVGDIPAEMPERVIISEGYATAVSVSLLTEGWSVAAISKTNLKPAAEAIRGKWPEIQIVIAGDNDFEDGKPNDGKDKAISAAIAVKGRVSVPPGRVKIDWDDYRRQFGLKRAREAFREELFDPLDTGTQTPAGFRLTSDYLWFDQAKSDEGGNGQTKQIKVCSPLRVAAITHDADGGSFGRLLEWDDSNGIKHRWAMPMKEIAGTGQNLREILLDNGLRYIAVDGLGRQLLMNYISNCLPAHRVTCVNKTGWYGGSYVFSSEVIGGDAGSVIYQSAQSSKDDFRVSGDSAEWVERTGRYCAGNSRLVFCVSLAFAAPLLRLLGTGGGGYHLKGESTDGKTTTMKVAASVCGGADYWKTWRATGNALEEIALRRNDAPLMLDEISEVNGTEATQIAYMLGNGQSKSRSKSAGGLRDAGLWRLLFLSTGEVSISEHAAEAGKQRTGAGVGVRMVQIPSDTGKHGAFENLHGFSGGKEFAEYLEKSAAKCHGAPFRDWLRWLTADLNAATERAGKLLKQYEKMLRPEGAGNQTGRIVNRFALLAVAGELATEAGLTGWEQGEAYKAAKSCLDAWISDRGHIANQEEADALERVRNFITTNQYTRFASWYAHDKNRPSNVVGFRKVEEGNDSREAETTFYIFASGWKEICGTFNAKKTADLCRQKGWLMPDTDGKNSQNIRLPEVGQKRVYVLNSKVIG